jgi:catechol 2,3-dioxygenase-like lactoylglutathione lyase family enzyme
MSPIPLWLDHVSIAVPELEAARAHLEARLGLVPTVTPNAPDRHSRVYLHRTYLEVAADPTASGWRATHFFLRFSDPETLTTHLNSAGLSFRFDEYPGVDGRWDNVEIAPSGGPFPILVRRTYPPEVAADWPPPLHRPQPGGARSLLAVHVAVAEWEATLDVYRRLLPGRGVATENRDRRSATFAASSGRIELREAVTPAIEGIVLELASWDTVPGSAAPIGHPPRGRVEWIDPMDTFGLEFGFSLETRVTRSEP